jgi:hypothetical protein
MILSVNATHMRRIDEGRTSVIGQTRTGPQIERPCETIKRMPDEAAAGVDRSLDLLYPFYLDSDMSMAFAAALAGGVALESEQVDRSDQTSQAVKNLRGNLRLFGALGMQGGRDSTEASVVASESRLIRRHTDASIFIDLYDELRRTGRLIEDPELEDLSTGDIVSARMGPAVAPLRRVVDQVIRLFDLTMPVLAGEPKDAETTVGQSTRRRKGQHPRAPKPTPDPDEDGLSELRQMHRLFVALRDDLEQSGMIDIVVAREDQPSVVITLDKRFVADPAIELLHTSAFTIVGKVTNIWRGPNDLANLYRRSVVSLLPALAQTVTWGLLMLLSSLARGFDPTEIERMAYSAAGVQKEDDTATGSDEPGVDGSAPAAGGDEARDESARSPENDEESQPEEVPDEVLFGEEVIAALNPVVVGPAFQILPLAICS